MVPDAQAAGVPVVTTHAPAGDGTGALVVPARDPEALCGALARPVDDDELQHSLRLSP